MPALLTVEELKEELAVNYTISVNRDSKKKREENIKFFIEIDRNNLKHGKCEKRLQLYTTLFNEKICIQYPGKESEEKPKKPYDFRPKLIMSDGTIMKDASFGFIWDLFEGVTQRHNDYLCLVATVLWYQGYMYGYQKVKEKYIVEKVKIDKRRAITEYIEEEEELEFEWWKMNLDENIWFSLNNYIGQIPIDDGHSISFEALMKFLDLLLQNEDCKYYYLKKVMAKKDYKLDNGRTNTADANMAIIMYFEKKCSFSHIANKIQQGMGMPKFAKSNYHLVTDEIVRNT